MPGTVSGNLSEMRAGSSAPQPPYRKFQGPFLERATSQTGQDLQDPSNFLPSWHALLGAPGIAYDMAREGYRRWQTRDQPDTTDPAETVGHLGTAALTGLITHAADTIPGPAEAAAPRIPLWKSVQAEGTEVPSILNRQTYAQPARAPRAQAQLPAAFQTAPAPYRPPVGTADEPLTLRERMMVPESPPVYPGAPNPQAPPPETLKARVLAQGGQAWHDPAAGLGTVKQERLVEQMGGKPVETITQHSHWPPEQQRIVPSVRDIRQSLQGPRPTPESLEDRAVQQELNWDLERHGRAAESEALRRSIAGSSTGVTKGELTGQVERPVRYTKTPGVTLADKVRRVPGASEDLTSLLKQSVKWAKQKGD